MKKIDLYNDGIGFVQLFDNTNINSYDDVKKMIADAASVTRGRFESNNPNSVYKSILRESGIGLPGRPFEYVGMTSNMKVPSYLAKEFNTIVNSLSFAYDDGKIKYFNYRDFLNTSIKIDSKFSISQIESMKQHKDFIVIIGKVPKFVYDHIRTHTQISWMSETVRVKNIKEIEFWNPEGHNELYNELNANSIENYNKSKLNGMPEEIAARELPSRRYVKFICSAWNNNPLSYEHFITERTKRATQLQTQELAYAIKQIIIR